MKKSNFPFIGLAGNIGVGKTTFTRKIALRQNWTPFYESVTDNPYLSDFYKNMGRWGFHLQIYFLHKRFDSHLQMSRIQSGVIQDRTIYEDMEIFARNLHELHHLSDRDWDNYCGLFSAMITFLKKPDLIVYLKASTDTLITRIHSRGRDYEQSIDPQYLHILNICYERWINSLPEKDILVIDTDEFNIYEQDDKLQHFESMILERLSLKSS